MGSGQLPVQAHSAAARCSALNNAIKDEVHSRTAQTTILATGSAFALLMAALGDHAHGEGNLRRDLYDLIRAHSRGDITARVVVGDSEYAISARSRVDAIPARRWCGRSFFHIALFEDHCGCQ